MKNFILAAIATIAFTGVANAETRELAPFAPCDNWSITLKGGIATPLNRMEGSFKENIRGVAGLEIRKQIAPSFGLGAEGDFGFNTSTWNKRHSMHNIVDNSYVGLFGAVNLNNLFAGYAGQPRPFEIELVAGTGWIHGFRPSSQGSDYDDIGVKTGLNLNFNLGEAKAWTIALKPSILWNASGKEFKAFSGRAATLGLLAGITYHFGNSNGTHSFAFAAPCDYSEYNEQINSLRAMVTAQEAGIADLTTTNANLKAQLNECLNRPATVVTNTVVETNNNLQSIRYIFYKIGSSKITSDQQPNVEMIANYMKKNPKSTVVIKGYASKDGNLSFNERLAAARAQSVKSMLTNKYGIKADRIKAEGQGIGEMFKEESWNRVAICILDDNN